MKKSKFKVEEPPGDLTVLGEKLGSIPAAEWYAMNDRERTARIAAIVAEAHRRKEQQAFTE